MIDWAREKFGTEIQTTNTILFSPQPEATKEVFDKVMQSFDAWQMAGVFPFLLLTGSF